MIIIKSPREIALMRVAGEIVASVFEAIAPLMKPGVSTGEIDEVAEKTIRSQNAIPTFKGYNGFPKSTCISINDVLIHGIPDYKTILKDGDIVSVDVGATYEGYVGDAARTYLIGNVDQRVKKLVQTTEESFYEALKIIKPGIRVGDISSAIQKYNENAGYSLPREYTGHGVGRNMHEDPMVPNVGTPNTGPILKAGMCIAIEPMVSMGRPQTYVLKDDWTVKMSDGSYSAHYENTIVVTDEGYEILTKRGE